MNIFLKAFKSSIDAKLKCIDQGFDLLEEMGEKISASMLSGGKLFLCGNGGSAADAQHLAAELLVRLRPNVDRIPLPAVSLALDTSTITACANDYSFDDLFSRNLMALARPGDCLLVISTSGKSLNILNALQQARNMNVAAYSFLGGSGGGCLQESDLAYVVPSNNTASIQEAHIVAGHALMQFIEETVCGI